MKRLLFVLAFVPSLLLAQKEPGAGAGPRRPGPFEEDTTLPRAARAFSLGIISYTGGAWVPSGLEAAELWRLWPNASTSAGVSLALGSFIENSGVLFNRSHGFFVTLGATLRQPIVSIVDVGSERNPSKIKLEASLEAAGTSDIDSPLPQGPWGGRASALLGITFGSPDALGQSVGLFFGPAVLVGRTSTTHGMIAFRMRMPLLRH